MTIEERGVVSRSALFCMSAAFVDGPAGDVEAAADVQLACDEDCCLIAGTVNVRAYGQ